MKSLNEFLQLKEVTTGIETNINPFKNENSVVENKLYYAEKDKMYLVEVRIFNNDTMENAYLDVFNDDMSHFDEYIDDVWSFADWSEIN